ncbi:MAG: DUF4974 domain-containing protein [Cyclobacteriaceae bacterium]|nr:DUF4974 domain-containing protein [Cyclobacteriaceae bacterium]
MKELIAKYLTNNISDEEKKSLYTWLKEPENQKVFKKHVNDNNILNFTNTDVNTVKAFDQVLTKIDSLPTARKRQLPLWFRYAAVFAGLLMFSYGLYIVIFNSKPKTLPQITLQLADGSIQVLDESQAEIIIDKNGQEIVNHQFNKLSYKQKIKKEGTIVYNELTVPYGRKFQLVLSDGTHIFLNAGTKLKYPKAFSSKGTREVFLDGEAYFSVTENKANPFVVSTDKMSVQVLGTTFNVSSYKNEHNTSATLVEGSVAVYETGEKYSKNESTTIVPGQQVSLKEEVFTVHEVNIKKHIAWTEGKLYFVNDRFENIIKEMERHYNVEIINKHTALNKVRYNGTFKTETIIEILDVFKKNTEFEYRMEGRKIVISER